jgi:hypothetical protein
MKLKTAKKSLKTAKKYGFGFQAKTAVPAFSVPITALLFPAGWQKGKHRKGNIVRCDSTYIVV